MRTLMQLVATGSGTAFVVELAVKASVVLAVTWLVTLGLRRASAATRHAVWMVGLTVAAIIPLGSAVLPALRIPVFAAEATIDAPMMPAAPVGAAAVSDVPHVERRGDDGSHASVPVGERIASEPGGPEGFRLASVMAWGFLLWWVGSALLVVRLFADRVRVSLVTRYAAAAADDRVLHIAGAAAAELGIARRFRVVQSTWLSVPVNCGLLRPVVVLPNGAEDWTDERLRVVMLHELAHIRRWDYATHLIAQVASAIHWANPLVWVAVRRTHREQEQACDDVVLRVGTESTDYATHLLEIARAIVVGRQLQGALAMAAPVTLRDRVRAILDRESNRGPTARRTVGVTAMVAALVTVPLASLSVWEARNNVAAAVRQVERLQAADPTTRASAAWALGQIPSSTSLDGLVRALDDEDPQVRGIAALALGEQEGRTAPDALLGALDDDDSYVRENAVLALYRFPADPRARQGLIRMTRDPAHGVRSVTTWALGELGGQDAAEALARMIMKDADRHTRGMAISALRDMDVESRVPTLVRTLEEHPDSETREGAAYALGRLRDARAVGPLVRALTEDPSMDVRAQAARALHALPDPEAVGGLLAALEDADRMVRQHAVSALAAIDHPDAVEGVLRALRDPVHQVRLTAVWELNELKNR